MTIWFDMSRFMCFHCLISLRKSVTMRASEEVFQSWHIKRYKWILRSVVEVDFNEDHAVTQPHGQESLQPVKAHKSTTAGTHRSYTNTQRQELLTQSLAGKHSCLLPQATCCLPTPRMESERVQGSKLPSSSSKLNKLIPLWKLFKVLFSGS